MHPAYSVIVFTTASGAGYGLMFWLAIAALNGAVPDGWAGLSALTLALALFTAGLLSSTFHLGHPERAWRAFSQWRSSWLSREGVAAVATYVPAGLWWLSMATGVGGDAVPVLAGLSAVGAVVTVWCTGMIYACLRTVPEWHRDEVAPIYLLLAASTGALLLALILSMVPGGAPVWLLVAAVISLAAAGAMKLRYWSAIDAEPAPYTTEQATGLGGLGTVRTLDPPHTAPNFVMREMGYRVARKHADRLRGYTKIALFLAPVVLIAAALAVPGIPVLFAVLAVASAALGIVMERWLFFAEARHISMLFYQGK